MTKIISIARAISVPQRYIENTDFYSICCAVSC